MTNDILTVTCKLKKLTVENEKKDNTSDFNSFDTVLHEL